MLQSQWRISIAPGDWSHWKAAFWDQNSCLRDPWIKAGLKIPPKSGVENGCNLQELQKTISCETSKTQIHVKLVEKLQKIAKRPVRLPISHLRAFFFWWWKDLKDQWWFISFFQVPKHKGNFCWTERWAGMACWWLVVPLWVWHGAARVLSKEVFRKLMEHRRWINKMKISWLKSSFEARCGQSLKWKTSTWMVFGKTENRFSAFRKRFSEIYWRTVFVGGNSSPPPSTVPSRCPVLRPFFFTSRSVFIVKDDTNSRHFFGGSARSCNTPKTKSPKCLKWHEKNEDGKTWISILNR